MLELCANPFCKAEISLGKRKRARFCSDQCRLNAWIVAKAAKLLLPMPLGVLVEMLSAAKKIAAGPRIVYESEANPERDLISGK